MDLITQIQAGVAAAVQALYTVQVAPADVTVAPTRKEFTGDYTVVVFPYTKIARKKPEEIGRELGEQLRAQLPVVADFNVIQGFLNLSISTNYWRDFLLDIYQDPHFGRSPRLGRKVMVEFSSPNTNKPLHLGHIRNILLGWSISQILDTVGYDVLKVQVVNDRGIAICRSMLAWERFGEGATPDSTGLKGDHFVGRFYVEFARRYELEYQAWQQTPAGQAVLAARAKEGQSPEEFFKAYKNDYFNEHSELGAAARDMLLRWEDNDPEVRALWRKMNDWVLAGFDETYAKLGVHFDKLYFESDTYLLGKEIIEEGLQRGILQPDGKRVWIDLDHIGLGQKTILKSDGASTYTSQDLGTARQRYQDFGVEKMIYVVGDEQNSHFQGLFEILKRLGEPYADGLYHLSYGMVDLPTGRMKSREGTVVDADDLVQEVIAEARANSLERETTAELSAAEREEIVRQIGLAALKFFIVKVNPQKRMIFDPKESVDLHGQTGPYVQNAYVRIQSVLRKAGDAALDLAATYHAVNEDEKDLVRQLYTFPAVLAQAAQAYDPSEVASFAYNLAKSFHKFYHDYSILNAESDDARHFRLALSRAIGQVLAHSMRLLGIEMPERM